jgi:hypothetical protein
VAETESVVLYEAQDRVATVTLNRPAARRRGTPPGGHRDDLSGLCLPGAGEQCGLLSASAVPRRIDRVGTASAAITTMAASPRGLWPGLHRGGPVGPPVAGSCCRATCPRRGMDRTARPNAYLPGEGDGKRWEFRTARRSAP